MVSSSIPVQRETAITTSEAARLLGVAQRTVNNWIRRGNISSWQTAGGHRRIPLSQIQELLRERQTQLEGGGEPLKLLVVEDDGELLELYRRTLAGWEPPVRLITASDGMEGLIQAGLHRPDMVVMDLLLPGLDGFRIVHKLMATADLRGTRVVVVTALDAREIAHQGGLPPEVVVLHKPVPFQRIERLAREQRRRGARHRTRGMAGRGGEGGHGMVGGGAG